MYQDIIAALAKIQNEIEFAYVVIIIMLLGIVVALGYILNRLEKLEKTKQSEK